MIQLLLLLCLAGAAAAEVKISGPFAALEGERCVVCNSPLTGRDSAYIVEGRRVAVSREMEAEFLADPLHYVASLGPGSTGGRPAPNQPRGYLWAAAFVTVGLMFGGACAHLAAMRGLSTWRWFLAGFCFSAPAMMALARKPMQRPPEMLR